MMSSATTSTWAARIGSGLADATTREIEGAGHLDPQLARQAVADALTHHLTAAHAHA